MKHQQAHRALAISDAASGDQHVQLGDARHLWQRDEVTAAKAAHLTLDAALS